MNKNKNTRPFPDTPEHVREVVLPTAIAETLRNLYGDTLVKLPFPQPEA